MNVPELYRAIVTAGGELVLTVIAPIQVMDTRHVSRDVPRGSGGFL